MTVRDALREAEDRLRGAGCPSADVDAEWLLAHVLGVSRTELRADGRGQLSDEDRRFFGAAVARRAAREPLAYILGEWGFRRLTLRVDPRVLVPRPETEVLVERCLALLADVREPRVLDVGVGSGAIALAIADERPDAYVVATESSRDALDVARDNRSRAGLEQRVELVEGELFAGCAGPFDLVVSNPPYVAFEDVETLDPEVRFFEPRDALVATGVTEQLVDQARDVLRPGGALALETADGAAEAVASKLDAGGYVKVTITNDLAGRERIVDGRAPR